MSTEVYFLLFCGSYKLTPRDGHFIISNALDPVTFFGFGFIKEQTSNLQP